MVVFVGSFDVAKAQIITPPLPGAERPAHHDPRKSPFQSFRDLLSAPPSEREEILKSKPEVHRRHLQDRLKEFDRLQPAEKETQLKMMELRWYLVPLLSLAPSNRVDRLSLIPPDLKLLVEDRLKKWDELPLNLRQEASQQGLVLQYLSRLESGTPTEQIKFWNSKLAGQNSTAPTAPSMQSVNMVPPPVPTGESKGLADHMNRFFELSKDEKQKTLEFFSGKERERVQETLSKLESVAPEQRKLYLESFQRFSQMDEESRRVFLKNAERWRHMSDEARKAFRELVTKLPPLPPGFNGPPLPPMPGHLSSTAAKP